LRVGIYDRWLGTLGGGERVVAAIAKAIGLDHDVDLLTHCSITSEALSHRFGTVLPRMRVIAVTDTPDYSGIIEASACYELFVNASHLDYFQPRARRNALLVYFPASSVGHARAIGAYNRAKLALRRRAGDLLGARARSALRRLVFRDATRSSDQSLLGALALRGFQYLSPVRSQAEILGGYDQILTISEFSQSWIRRYWGLESFIVYPPVDPTAFAPVPKRNQVLAVGRFFAGNHNKKQDLLVRAFRRAAGGPLAGWELHLAGGFQPTTTNQAFLDQVKEAVAGDPAVHLYLNCDVDELRALYGASKLFWHATGLGESELDHPERFEHFGISSLEAMAAGCIPLAFAGGGQPEIIRPGADGILWSTLDELVAESAALGRDESRREAMADAARRRAWEFGEEAFARRLKRALELEQVERASN
jgi:glycosyltransferase involved in cell wall biosynthesis